MTWSHLLLARIPACHKVRTTLETEYALVQRLVRGFAIVLLAAVIFPVTALCQNPLTLADKLVPIPQLPFQNNTTFGVGPNDTFVNSLNIQPVYPVRLGAFNLINRAILPVLYRGEMVPGEGGLFGLGDLSYTAFFTPSGASGIIWGIGPSVLIPTATDHQFGTGKWSGGGGIVLFFKEGRWLVGGLAQNVWSFAGETGRPDVSRFLGQYFINFGLDQFWYLTSEPTIKANWKAPDDRRWIIPVGGGFGRVFPSRSHPAHLIVQGFYNVKRPPGGGDWTLRIELKLFFVPAIRDS
ncbi:MAG: neuromedin U [Ignavibacteria bacterium]|nr:neuromedin U [Ignavibacteria bacterium]